MSHLLAAAAGSQSILDLIVGFMPMILIFAIFYFIWFVPIRKKQKHHEAVLAALKKGDKVITNGGIYGEVVKVEGQVLVLKLADNVKVRIQRQAIAGLEGAPAEGASS